MLDNKDYGILSLTAKTKLMCFVTRQQLVKLNLDDLANTFSIYIYLAYTFSATARHLGVLLDQELTFASHQSLLLLSTATTVGYSELLHVRCIYMYSCPCLHYFTARLLSNPLYWSASLPIVKSCSRVAICRAPYR